VREEPAPFLYEQERITALTSRVVRDRVFRRIVVKAYDARCAIT
jgi:putative restriction endonuclease